MTLTKSQKLRRKEAKSQGSAHASPKAKTTQKKSRSASKRITTKISEVPAAMTISMPRFKISGLESTCVRVTQYLTPISFPVFTGTANVLGSCLLNPSTLFTAGRLARFASLYEKYRWKKLSFHYVPATGTSSSGVVFMAIDLDPKDSVQNLNGYALMEAISSFGGRRYNSFPVYGAMNDQHANACSVLASTSDFPNQLFTDPTLDSDRWSYAGRLLYGIIGPSSGLPTVGHIYLDAEIEFYEPSLESLGSGSSTCFGWKIVNPSNNAPLGAVADNIFLTNNNLAIKYSVTLPDGSTPGSTILFENPGVYFLSWRTSGTSMSTGTFTYSEGVVTGVSGLVDPFQDVAYWPSQSVNGGLTHCNTSVLLTVPKANGWISWKTSGDSHSSGNYVFIQLTPIPIPNNSPAPKDELLREQVSTLVNSLKSAQRERQWYLNQMDDLSRQVADMKMDIQESKVHSRVSSSSHPGGRKPSPDEGFGSIETGADPGNILPFDSDQAYVFQGTEYSSVSAPITVDVLPASKKAIGTANEKGTWYSIPHNCGGLRKPC